MFPTRIGLMLLLTAVALSAAVPAVFPAKAWTVAASVWMVDGVCLLEDASYATKVLFDFLQGTNKRLLQSLFGSVLGFFIRAKRASSVLEAFLYEDESRRLWHSTHRGKIPLAKMSGVPGVGNLGVSHLQSSWTAWNMLEDQREDQEYAWSLAKVNVALQSDKSAKKLDARDKNRHETEKARRLEVQEKAFRRFRGEPENASEVAANAAGLKVRAPKTATELSEEMRHWLSGEMDDHDRVVAEYKDRLRQTFFDNEAAKAALLEESRRRREREKTDLGSSRTRLVAFTPRELSEKFPEASRPGAKFIVEADPVSRTFNRYLRDEPTTYGLAVEGDKITVNGPSPQDPPPPLSDQIANRKPKFNGD